MLPHRPESRWHLSRSSEHRAAQQIRGRIPGLSLVPLAAPILPSPRPAPPPVRARARPTPIHPPTKEVAAAASHTAKMTSHKTTFQTRSLQGFADRQGPDPDFAWLHDNNTAVIQRICYALQNPAQKFELHVRFSPEARRNKIIEGPFEPFSARRSPKSVSVVTRIRPSASARARTASSSAACNP